MPRARYNILTRFVARQSLHSRYNDMNRDLTNGKPSTVLWRFCLPLFGSIIFQQLYNIADSFVAGKFIGEEALAAVGNSYEITLIFIAFAFILSPRMGYTGIWSAWPVGWCVATALSIGFFASAQRNTVHTDI